MFRTRSQLENLSKGELIDELISVEDISSKLSDLASCFDDFCDSLEISPVPASIGDDVLESSICKALSVTGHEVKPDDLQACHRLKKKDTVIVKFKCRKQKCNVLINRKYLRNKSDLLSQLNFSGRLFVSESICHENHQLSYKCRQLARFM